MAAAIERDKAQKFMYELLRLMLARKASDLFITAGFPPAVKVDGKITPINNQISLRSIRRNSRALS